MPKQYRNIKRNAARRTVKYPGIVDAAKALKVSRIHLWYVLEGERESPRIMASPLVHKIRAASVRATKVSRAA